MSANGIATHGWPAIPVSENRKAENRKVGFTLLYSTCSRSFKAFQVWLRQVQCLQTL